MSESGGYADFTQGSLGAAARDDFTKKLKEEDEEEK